jgi:hypothetical protein
MSHSIEVGGVTCNGESLGRSYQDESRGIRGAIMAGFGSNIVRVSHQDAGEAEPHWDAVEAGSVDSAERSITEEFAAIQAIGSVIGETETEGQAAV